MTRLLPILAILLLSACTTRVSVGYAPSVPNISRGAPVVAEVAATDARGESAADASWIGSIRGGFGNPLKRLESDRPVGEMVADATRDALRVRGLLADGGGPYRVQVTIEQLESDQVARREAKVRLRFAWLRRTDGQILFRNTGEADVVTGSVLTLQAGVFGSTDELRATLAQALSEAIDRALDDPELSRFLLGVHP